MRETRLTLPELALIAGTRGALGFALAFCYQVGGTRPSARPSGARL